MAARQGYTLAGRRTRSALLPSGICADSFIVVRLLQIQRQVRRGAIRSTTSPKLCCRLEVSPPPYDSGRFRSSPLAEQSSDL
jgi:hypothetical protein